MYRFHLFHSQNIYRILFYKREANSKSQTNALFALDLLQVLFEASCWPYIISLRLKK